MHKVFTKTHIFAYVVSFRDRKMKKTLTLLFAFAMILSVRAQEVYTLERCRELALSNNKQLSISKISQDVAENMRRAAQTKKLPRVSGMLGYEHFSREISILNKNQKSALSNLGTNATNGVTSEFSTAIDNLVQRGFISPEAAQRIEANLQERTAPIAQAGDKFGETIKDAFRTNTKDMWAGSVMVTQPIYMGGAITAANEMACLSEEMAANNVDNIQQNTLYAIDNAYWLAVSLKNKQHLASDFLDLVKKLNDDVHKLIREGVATRADGLKVDVAVNNAEMALTQVEDGVSLSKMYLCQLCGLPLDGDIKLADEEKSEFDCAPLSAEAITDSTYSQRPEIKLLENTINMSRLTTKLIQSAYKPHVALTGGVLVSNPNLFNGFERRFREVWNIGVMVQVPIWSWHEGRYKVNASRAATKMAELELQDAREKISLQVEQHRFKVKEANKRLQMSRKNMSSAEENLRCANVGFREGVMTITEVMEAQTAWQKAQSQKIDAEIELRLSQIGLQKALGVVGE